MSIKETAVNSNIKGISFLILALLFLSIQNIVVKWLGGSYPVLEIVVLRSIVALPLTLLLYRGEGKKGLPRTRQPRLEIIRGAFLFISYTTFMMGVIALPLAQVESIRFSGPLMITVLSIVFLREKVALRRWIILITGFAGILLIIQPRSANFNIGIVFILLNVLFYALTVISTRKLKTTDSSATMAFYSSLVYLAAALILIPVTLSARNFRAENPCLAFLFHNWVIPTFRDGLIMCSLGIIWAGWAYSMTCAYSLVQASVIASFEYLSLPINSLWGFLFWREIPTWTTLAGAALILLSNLFILYLDNRKRDNVSTATN